MKVFPWNPEVILAEDKLQIVFYSNYNQNSN